MKKSVAKKVLCGTPAAKKKAAVKKASPTAAKKVPKKVGAKKAPASLVSTALTAVPAGDAAGAATSA